MKNNMKNYNFKVGQRYIVGKSSSEEGSKIEITKVEDYLISYKPIERGIPGVWLNFMVGSVFAEELILINMNKEFKVGQRYILKQKYNSYLDVSNDDILEVETIYSKSVRCKNLTTKRKVNAGFGMESSFAEELVLIKYTPDYLKENPIIVQVNNKWEEKQLFDLGLHYCSEKSIKPEELSNRSFEKKGYYRIYLQKDGGWNHGDFLGEGYLGADTQIIQAQEILNEYNIKPETMNKKVVAYKVIKAFPTPERDYQVGQEIKPVGSKSMFDKAPNYPEFFEAIYEEEFKVGDWVYILDSGFHISGTKNTRMTIGEIKQIKELTAVFSYKRGIIFTDGVKGGFCDNWNISDYIRKATPEEIAQANVFELPHSEGTLKITMEKDKFNVRGEGLFTVEDLNKIMKKCQDLDEEDNLRWEIEVTEVSIGCKKGIKVSDLQALKDKHNQIFGF